MQIPLNWISCFTDISELRTNKNIRDIAHEYSIHAAEIESITPYQSIDLVVVGKVLTAVRHPESTKLWVCTVQIDQAGNTETILTGAPNVYAGMYTPTALVGCQIAPDFVIGERKMAGMISRGMMCGADEIGVTRNTAAGIMDLLVDYSQSELEAHIGESFYTLGAPFLSPENTPVRIPFEDQILEIDNKNMTNRPDLFGIIGHAREFAAQYRTWLNPSHVRSNPATLANWQNSHLLKVEIQTPNVRSYNLATLSGVTPAQTPLGIMMMLERCGLTSHDAIVDMTNYVMMEYGQPMHAFDADTIEGHIIVRQARAGEMLITLDGKERSLMDGDIVIADTVKILGLAGVMGGMCSRITESTKNIAIESAVFDPISIRLTAQRLGLRSDASTRFEKSIDPLAAEDALIRGLNILHFSKVGGVLTGQSHFVNESVINRITLRVTPEFVTDRLGKHLSLEEMVDILARLEFAPRIESGEIVVTVPPHRATKDVTIVEDLVEEIGRIIGYDAIVEAPIPGKFTITRSNTEVIKRRKIQDFLLGQGLYEAYNYSFSNELKDASVGITDSEGAIMIKNAVSEEYTSMRRSLTPLLFANVRENLKKIDRVGFYEIAKIHNQDAHGFHEEKCLGIILSQSTLESARKIYDGVLELLGADILIESPAIASYFHPMASGRYMINGEMIAEFGRIHPQVAREYNLGSEACYFECYLDRLQSHTIVQSGLKQGYIEPNKYPNITRELNFIMDERTPTRIAAGLIAAVDPRIHSLELVGTYQGAGIAPGSKSVTYRFVVEDRTKTITDEEALALQNQVIAELAKWGFMLRG